MRNSASLELASISPEVALDGVAGGMIEMVALSCVKSGVVQDGTGCSGLEDDCYEGRCDVGEDCGLRNVPRHQL